MLIERGGGKNLTSYAVLPLTCFVISGRSLLSVSVFTNWGGDGFVLCKV